MERKTRGRICLTSLSLLLFGFAAAAAAGAPQGFEAWLAQGKRLSADGKFLEAEAALKKALSLKPDDPEAGGELASVYDATSRLEEEARLLKRLIGKSPQEYPLYSRLARAEIRLGRPAEARATFARARNIGGNTAESYIEEGYFDFDSGDYARSKDDFENAIAVDTASPFGYHHMGTYLSNSRAYPESEKYLRRALKKLEADPKSRNDDVLHTLKWLGDVLRAQGRLTEAKGVYLEGLKRAGPGDDRQLRLLRSLAKLYLSQGKDALAGDAYNRAAAFCAPPVKCRIWFAGDALIDLGEFELRQGRRAEAEAMAKRAEEFCAGVPDSDDLFNVLEHLAAFYAGLGDASKTKSVYDRLLPLRRTMPYNPYLVWVETGSGDLDAAQGRYQEAKDLYRRAIGILEHNGFWQEEADTLDNLAAIDENSGDRAAADAARERAKTLRARR